MVNIILNVVDNDRKFDVLMCWTNFNILDCTALYKSVAEWTESLPLLQLKKN